MKLRRTLFGVLALTTWPALAQEKAAPPPPAALEQPGVKTEKASDVPEAEKLRRSSESLTRMREVLRDTLSRLEEARRTKDVVKLNCVNEKLTQVKGLLRISEQADVSLQEALTQKDQTTADHEYTKVMIARQKVEQLRADSEECIGQLAFRTDENLTVEVDEPENFYGKDPTRPAPPPAAQVRPPPASPTM